MSEYKRLTKWEMNKGVKCVKYWQYSQEQIAERLALLEDKIENETLYAFPFRIGQKVYIVCDWDIGEAVEGIITEIEFTTNKNGTHHRIYVDHKYIFSKTNPNVVNYRYIFMAEELFTDKTKAESRLKELQEEQK